MTLTIDIGSFIAGALAALFILSYFVGWYAPRGKGDDK